MFNRRRPRTNCKCRNRNDRQRVDRHETEQHQYRKIGAKHGVSDFVKNFTSAISESTDHDVLIQRLRQVETTERKSYIERRKGANARNSYRCECSPGWSVGSASRFPLRFRRFPPSPPTFHTCQFNRIAGSPAWPRNTG